MKRLVVAVACAATVIGVAAPASAVVIPAKKYSIAQVKRHASPSDCWSAVNGKVYNLTGWISRHPGGSQRIIAMCGKDASAAFNAQHGGRKSVAAILSGFRIGSLA